jgi:hypothetical protein
MLCKYNEIKNYIKSWISSAFYTSGKKSHIPFSVSDLYRNYSPCQPLYVCEQFWLSLENKIEETKFYFFFV